MSLLPEYWCKKITISLILVCFSLLNMGLASISGLVQDSQTETSPATLTTSPTFTSIGTEQSTGMGDVLTMTSTPVAETVLEIINTPFVETISEDISETPVFPEASLDPETPLSENILSQPIPSVTLYGEYSVDEVIVKFRQKTSELNISQCMDAANATISSQLDELGSLLLKVPEGKVPEAISVFLSCPDIQYAEPNYLLSSTDTFPDDPNWANQYGLNNIHAPQGWDVLTGSTAVTIAVIDTGVDFGHLDLAYKIVPGYDFVNNDSNPQDDNGHGTHVAGIAAASSNNGTGISGVSWGARIMPVKVLNAGGGGSYANVAQGIIWATDNGAQIINLSLGGGAFSATLQNAVDYAYGQGVTIIASSGNSGSNFVLYPARFPHVIAVGATDSSDTRAWLSNYGPELDLVAPGISIYSTTIGGYGYKSGTSMSAPFVAGLAAIIRGVAGYGSPDMIEWVMESNALDLGLAGKDDLYGYGLIQMDAALLFVLPPTPAPTPTPTPPVSPRTNQPDYGSGYFPLTNTPSPPPSPLPSATPTQTLSADAIEIYSSPVFTPVMGPQPESERAEEEFEVEAQVQAKSSMGEFIMPCTGISLILAGILLFWLTSRKERRRSTRIKRSRHW
jgi:thermitase